VLTLDCCLDSFAAVAVVEAGLASHPVGLDSTALLMLDCHLLDFLGLAGSDSMQTLILNLAVVVADFVVAIAAAVVAVVVAAAAVVVA